jgi:hypothetical protein
MRGTGWFVGALLLGCTAAGANAQTANEKINDPRPKGRGIQNSASWRSSWSFR